MRRIGPCRAKSTDDHGTPNRKVQLERIFSYRAAGEDDVGAALAEYIRLGFHPFDEVRLKSFNNRPWYDAFVERDGKIAYNPSLADADRQYLGTRILDAQLEQGRVAGGRGLGLNFLVPCLLGFHCYGPPEPSATPAMFGIGMGKLRVQGGGPSPRPQGTAVRGWCA